MGVQEPKEYLLYSLIEPIICAADLAAAWRLL